MRKKFRLFLHLECNPIREIEIIKLNLIRFTSSDISEICTSAPLHFPNTRISVADVSKARSSFGIKSVMMVDLIFSFQTRKGDRRNGSRNSKRKQNYFYPENFEIK